MRLGPRFAFRYQGKSRSWSALLGRASDQAVEVLDRPDFVHVRVWSGPNRVDAVARNTRMRNVYDLPVNVGYDGVFPAFQVLGPYRPPVMDLKTVSLETKPGCPWRCEYCGRMQPVERLVCENCGGGM